METTTQTQTTTAPVNGAASVIQDANAAETEAAYAKIAQSDKARELAAAADDEAKAATTALREKLAAQLAAVDETLLKRGWAPPKLEARGIDTPARRTAQPTRRARKPVEAAPKVAPAKAAKSGKPARLPRRSTDQLNALLDKVAGFLKGKDGQSSEKIQQALGFDKREMPRILKLGLETKRLKSTGEKRATRYSSKG